MMATSTDSSMVGTSSINSESNSNNNSSIRDDGQAPPDLPILYRDSTPRDVFSDAVWGPVFNHRREVASRIPRAVVRATSPSHVAAAVRVARQLGCRVSVRSGGHSWAVWSVRDDAVLIDLGALPGGKKHHPPPSSSSSGTGTGTGTDGGEEGLVFDAGSKIVSCPPSATGRQVNGFLQTKGRMFAGGHCPDVGLGGFLLQGGMGWNCKNWGWACESIVGLDAVTAEGEEVYCSKAENADLFWAARGAGPGFPAIVTRFYLMTRALPEMFQSIYFWPISELKKVLQWVIDICPDADPDTEIVALSQYIPGYDEPIVMANFLAFKPSQAEGEAALGPLHDHPDRPPNALPQSFFAQPTSLPHQYDPQEAANPANHRYCAENAYIRNDADVPAVLEKACTTLPNRKTFALYFNMVPTSRRGHYTAGVDDVGSMALSMQSDHYFALYTVWEEEKDDGKMMGWVQDVMADMERHADGSYLGDADFQYRRTKFWKDENAKRLMEIRKKWDPEGRICGYLDEGDKSGVEGLKNEFEWK